MSPERRLRVLMASAGITGAELSQELDVSPTAVSHWLSGRSRSEEMTDALASAFDLPSHYLSADWVDLSRAEVIDLALMIVGFEVEK